MAAVSADESSLTLQPAVDLAMVQKSASATLMTEDTGVTAVYRVGQLGSPSRQTRRRRFVVRDGGGSEGWQWQSELCLCSLCRGSLSCVSAVCIVAVGAVSLQSVSWRSELCLYSLCLRCHRHESGSCRTNHASGTVWPQGYTKGRTTGGASSICASWDRKPQPWQRGCDAGFIGVAHRGKSGTLKNGGDGDL